MLEIARVYPPSSEAVIFFAGLVIFLGAALYPRGTVRSVGSLAVLTTLVGGWLFGAAHIWAARRCGMAVFASCDTPGGVANRWQWNAQLALAFVGAGLTGLAVSLLQRRRNVGLAVLVVAASAFGAWTWSADAGGVAILGIAGALLALASADNRRDHSAGAENGGHPAEAAPAREALGAVVGPPRQQAPSGAADVRPPRSPAIALGAAAAAIAVPVWVGISWVSLLAASEDHPAPGALKTALPLSLAGGALLAAGTIAAAARARRAAGALLVSAAFVFACWVALVASST